MENTANNVNKYLFCLISKDVWISYLKKKNNYKQCRQMHIRLRHDRVWAICQKSIHNAK